MISSWGFHGLGHRSQVRCVSTEKWCFSFIALHPLASFFPFCFYISLLWFQRTPPPLRQTPGFALVSSSYCFIIWGSIYFKLVRLQVFTTLAEATAAASSQASSYFIYGIKNIGNTCFANAVVQAYSASTHLLSYIDHSRESSEVNDVTR